ncbi:Serine/threonine-protein kinase-like protein ACR4 [Chlorella vulgaris]
MRRGAFCRVAVILEAVLVASSDQHGASSHCFECRFAAIAHRCRRLNSLCAASAQQSENALAPAPSSTEANQRLAAPGMVACWGNTQAWLPPPVPEGGLADNYTTLTTSASLETSADYGADDSDGVGALSLDGAPSIGAPAPAERDEEAPFHTWAPTEIASPFAFASISAEDSYACGITTGGAVACFGSNSPLRRDLDFSSPMLVPIAASFIKVATGATFACGLLSNASVACFGRMGGQLWAGPGSTEAQPTPQLVAGGLQFAELVAGGNHACGILLNGTAACFGSNEANQLGAQQDEDVQLGSSREPVVVADPSLAFTSLAAADTFSCGVLANATAVCWGGYTDASQSELLPAGLRELKPKQAQLFAALAARGSTVCGLTLQHSILCSGVVESFIDAQGYPETVFSTTPVPLPSTSSYTQLTIGGSGFFFHACGLTTLGKAECWGLNNEGQMGLPPFAIANSTTPQPVATGLYFSQLSAGGDYTCGVIA